MRQRSVGAVGFSVTRSPWQGVRATYRRSLYYYFVILLPIKYLWKTRRAHQVFTVRIGARLFTLKLIPRVAVRSRSLIEARTWKPLRANTKVFRAINTRGHVDRKEMHKFICDRSREPRAHRPLCKLFSARA